MDETARRPLSASILLYCRYDYGLLPLSESMQLTSFSYKEVLRMDNRLTIVLLIVLLAISSSHIICSKHFDSESSTRLKRTSVFLPSPLEPEPAQVIGRDRTAPQAAKDAIQHINTGSRILYKSRLGCLYTQNRLNYTRAAPDRYLAE